MNISIYQICYDSKQHINVDKDFILYDNSKYNQRFNKLNNPREYQVFLDNYKNINSDYTGYVSWKFRSKTGLTGRSFINNFTEHDLYFVNCGPRSIDNVWEQGERQHPGIIDFTQNIFDAINYDINIKKIKHCRSKTAFCNFWAGSPVFWSKYMKFTTPVYNYIKNNLTTEQKKFISSRACKGITSDYFPFIMERMFTTLLHVDSNISYINIPRTKA
jgi:hypothetical protein